MAIIYKIKNCSKEYLQSHKFRYCRYLSEYCDEVYVYKFPLVSYDKIITIECEISVSTMTGIVNVNVYKAGTRELYSSYYNREFGKCKILKSIEAKIHRKLKELGIEKI